MSAFRKEILDILENELKNPSTFLKQMIESSKNGMTSLNIIQQMSKDLCHIPLDYIIHCIKKDDRFAFDPFQVKVCLKSQLKIKLTKTTPYGTIDPEDDDDDDDDDDETKQDKEKAAVVYPEYKTPFFKPMFSTTEKIFPIFFDNDTFYVDDLPENQVNPEEPNVVVPEFDLYDITPLTNNEETLGIGRGLPKISGECFNCGSTEHKFTECPHPTDLKRVKEKRRKVNSRERFDRLYKELEIRNRVNLFVPGEISSTLRDALGMDEVQEPFYYKQMRVHGYPPGYLIRVDPSKPIPTFQSLNERNFKLEIEELKVFDDTYNSEDEDKKVETEARLEEPRETIEIKLVDYGVDFDKPDPKPEQEQEQGVVIDKLDAAIQRYNSIRSETNSSNDQSITNNHYYTQQQDVNSYQPDYPYQNSQDLYSYYYGYYDYSAYQQYDAYPPPPPPSSEPPPSSSHLPPPSLPPPPPAPPSQTYSDPSNYQPPPTIPDYTPPPAIPDYTPPQSNTSQSNQVVYDDNDIVDMEISDDDS